MITIKTFFTFCKRPLSREILSYLNLDRLFFNPNVLLINHGGLTVNKITKILKYKMKHEFIWSVKVSLVIEN